MPSWMLNVPVVNSNRSNYGNACHLEMRDVPTWSDIAVILKVFYTL